MSEHKSARDPKLPLRFVVIVAIALVWTAVISQGIPGVPFGELTTATVSALLTTAALLSLFIERAIEVVLLAWRGKERAKHLRELERFRLRRPNVASNESTATGSTGADLELRYDSFRADSLRIALLLGLLLGTIISGLGVRLLEPLLDARAIAELSSSQYRWLAGTDVFITGALLGGGANGIHRILDMFLTFVDVKRAEFKQSNPTAVQ